MGGIVGGFFAIFILFFLIITGGIVLLIVFMVRQGKSPNTQAEASAERAEVIAKAQAGRDELVPWMNRKATDIGTSMRYRSLRAFKSTLTGKLYSREQERILSFHRIQRGMNPHGLIAISSTDFDLFYIFDKTKIMMYYNKLLIAVWHSNGAITDGKNNVFGKAIHPDGIEFEIGGILEHRTGNKSYPVTLNNRELATVIINRRVSNFMEGFFSNDRDYGRVIEYKQTPTPEEEKILLMIAAHEMVYYGFSFNEMP